MFLTDEELTEVTGYVQRKKQAEVLRSFRPKVDFRVRPTDLRPLVPRWQFDLKPNGRTREPELGHLESA